MKGKNWAKPGVLKRRAAEAAAGTDLISVMLDGTLEEIKKGMTAQELVARRGIEATMIYVNNKPAWPRHHLNSGDVVSCRRTITES